MIAAVVMLAVACSGGLQPADGGLKAAATQYEVYAIRYATLPDFPVAGLVGEEGFGFQAATVRTLDDLQKLGPLLARPDGPLFLDCKLNAAIAAPFMSEIHEFETRRH